MKQATAWKVAHAVREMTDDPDGRELLPGSIVEVDTTYMGAPRGATRRSSTVTSTTRRARHEASLVAVAASRDGGHVAAAVRGARRSMPNPPFFEE